MVDEQDQQRARKNGIEKTRRNEEREHLERLSRLFKVIPRQEWSRQDLLGFGETVFLIDGCD